MTQTESLDQPVRAGDVEQGDQGHDLRFAQPARRHPPPARPVPRRPAQARRADHQAATRSTGSTRATRRCATARTSAASSSMTEARQLLDRVLGRGRRAASARSSSSSPRWPPIATCCWRVRPAPARARCCAPWPTSSASGFEFVEGNAELTPARLVGHFDPAAVLTDGYDPDVFVDGPLVSAMRDGSLLYVEEINRIPEETLNVLITVMSEARAARAAPRPACRAADGFRLVAAMNPFDAIGTARISSAVYDRVLPAGGGLPVGRRRGGHRRRRRGASASPMRRRRGARRRRGSPRWSTSCAARASTPRCASARRCAARSTRWPWPARWPACAASPPTDRGVGLDAAIVALSGRLRVREGGAAHAGGDRHRAVARGVRQRRRRGRRPGKSDRPGGGRPDSLNPDAPRRQGGRRRRPGGRRRPKRTISRRDLARNPRFEQMSPEVGELDESAVEEGLSDDPDDTLALLADLTGATDPKLRELARRLAGPRCPRPGAPWSGAAAGHRHDARAAVPARRWRPRHRRQPGGDRRGPRERRRRRRAPAGARLGASGPGAVPAGRPQRLDGRQAAGDGGDRRGRRGLARRRRLQRAGLRQGRRRRQGTGRRQGRRPGRQRRADPARLRHHRRRRRAAGRRRDSSAAAAPGARWPCCSATAGPPSTAIRSPRRAGSTSSR